MARKEIVSGGENGWMSSIRVSISGSSQSCSSELSSQSEGKCRELSEGTWCDQDWKSIMFVASGGSGLVGNGIWSSAK